MAKERPHAEKVLPMADPEYLRRQQEEELDTAWAWVKVAQALGRPITAREQAACNI
ncbi:MAG: hypothetical protein FWG25_06915 [Promicromonosporaceae bacterium]|nr:hypothetical protein [Promicromonosporaceae bacterium]